MNVSKVNRVEVIDQEGRSYTNWQCNNKVELSLQDDNTTLKVFVSTQENKSHNLDKNGKCIICGKQEK